MLITRGLLLCRRSGSAARVHRIWANSFLDVGLPVVVVDRVPNCPGRAAPAFDEPDVQPASADAEYRDEPGDLTGICGHPTVVATITAWPAACRSSQAAAAVSSASFREQIATLAPSASSSAAIALPSPFEPPVTMARRPVSPRSI